MSDERVAFRAFLIGDDGERHEITDRHLVSVASSAEDVRAAMTVAMDRLRAFLRSEPRA